MFKQVVTSLFSVRLITPGMVPCFPASLCLNKFIFPAAFALSIDIRTQRLDIANAAIHRQQSGANADRGRVAVL